VVRLLNVTLDAKYTPVLGYDAPNPILVEKRFRVCKIWNRMNRLRSLQLSCTT
jgi:hypothetical protein